MAGLGRPHHHGLSEAIVMTIAPFRLTVPGTDVDLIHVDGALTGGGHEFTQLGHGIWDLTKPSARAALDTFAESYARVRDAEGRTLTPAQVQALPSIEPDHPLASMWAQRKASFEVFHEWLHTEPNLSGDRSVVDIGAGCGWMAAHLASDQWHAAAVDITIDGGDGLAAARHHLEELLLVRAEMGALPFAANSVDLAVFNASLHYAADVAAALGEARRVVRPGGYLAVIDSPIFHDEAAGHQMVTEFAAQVHAAHGFAPPAHLGAGFVTWHDVDQAGLRPIAPDNGPRERFHRWRGARRAGREVAQRPQLVALCAADGATP